MQLGPNTLSSSFLLKGSPPTTISGILLVLALHGVFCSMDIFQYT